MINEYAVDPAIISSWERLQRILAQFGFDKNRLIARVPGKWQKAVIDSLPTHLSETERSKIVARLRDFEDLVCVPRVHDWSKTRTWLDNVKSSHAAEAFTLILTSVGDQISPPIVPYAELDEGNPPIGWVVSGMVERRKEEMAKALRLVLQSARQFVRFIDPHFHPMKSRFFAPMTEYLRCIRTVRAATAFPEIQIHTSDEHESEPFEKCCREQLKEIIPTGAQLTVVRWPRRRIHNRYILTEKAGVFLGTGTDENQYGLQGNDRDLFKLLNSVEREDFVEDYNPCGSRLGKPDETNGNKFVVVGTGR